MKKGSATATASPEGAELAAALEEGDSKRCVTLLEGLTEPARHLLFGLARKTRERFEDGEYKTVGKTSRFTYPSTTAQREAAMTAVLGTCSRADLEKLAATLAIPDEAVDVWRALKPSWLREAATALVAKNHNNFVVARALVREGLADAPQSPGYALGLLSYRFTLWGRRDQPLIDRLLEDPSLLEDEVWRLFEVEGGGETSLGAFDRFARNGTFADAFLSLMRAGHLDRGRLLDASLAALQRGFATFRAGWFSRFHEALEPTIAERCARLDVYLSLLSSDVGPTVSMAMQAVVAIADAGALPVERLGTLRAALSSPTKAVVKQALAIVAKAARQHAAARPLAARLALEALVCEAADVQRVALDVLDASGDSTDGELRALVADRASLVAASMRKRLAPWLGDAESKAAAPVNAAIEEAPLEPVPTSWLTADRVLTPLDSLSSVIEHFLHVLEDDGNPNWVELVLAGVARLAANRPKDFDMQIAPLVKRARKLLDPDGGARPLSSQMARLALTWGANEQKPPEPYASCELLHVFTERVTELSRTVAKRHAHVLLSTPTHRGGFLDPRELARRIVATETWSEVDAALAFLRVEREHAAEALAIVGRTKGELADAFRHAMGAKATIGPTVSLWAAAARARDPQGDDAAVDTVHSGLGPDEARAARVTWAAQPSGRPSPALDLRIEPVALSKRAPGAARIAAKFHEQSVAAFSLTLGQAPGLVRWTATLWPRGSEAFFTAAFPALYGNLDFWTSAWANAVVLERLLEPRTPFGPVARTILALELAAKEPQQAALAIDAAITALGDGRVDGNALGIAMAELRATGHIKHARWAKTLSVVSKTSPRHASSISTAMERCLRGDPKQPPRDEGAFIDLLFELHASRGTAITDPDARTYLSNSRHKRRL